MPIEKRPKKLPGDHYRKLSKKQLRSTLLDWAKQKPNVVTHDEYAKIIDSTILKRFGDGQELLEEVAAFLEMISKLDIGDDNRKQAEDAVKKIDTAFGAMAWGPHYANSEWFIPPPIVWCEEKK